MSLGEQIRKYRTEAGLTQEKLAEKLSVSSQAVSSWEQDKYAPDLDKIVELARVLGTTVGRLLEENRQPKNTNGCGCSMKSACIHLRRLRRQSGSCTRPRG